MSGLQNGSKNAEKTGSGQKLVQNIPTIGNLLTRKLTAGKQTIDKDKQTQGSFYTQDTIGNSWGNIIKHNRRHLGSP